MVSYQFSENQAKETADYFPFRPLTPLCVPFGIHWFFNLRECSLYVFRFIYTYKSLHSHIALEFRSTFPWTVIFRYFLLSSIRFVNFIFFTPLKFCPSSFVSPPDFFVSFRLLSSLLLPNRNPLNYNGASPLQYNKLDCLATFMTSADFSRQLLAVFPITFHTSVGPPVVRVFTFIPCKCNIYTPDSG